MSEFDLFNLSEKERQGVNELQKEIEKYNRKIQNSINASEMRLTKSFQLQNATNRSIAQTYHRDTKNELEKNRIHASLELQETRRDLKQHITAELTRLTTPIKRVNHSRLTSGSFVPSNLVVDDGESLSTALSSKASLTSVPITVHNRIADAHKVEVKKNADLEQEVKSLEMENKQLIETLRVKNETPLNKKLRAKPRKQALSENMENSVNQHVGNNINGRASRSSSRTALGDVNQTISNPGGLRRSARHATRN